MSGTFDSTLATGAFRVLAFDLEGRDLTGGIVRLLQGTIVLLCRVDCLPGWAIFQPQNGPYIIARDESVAQISAPQGNAPQAFQPAAPVYLTAGDDIVLPPAVMFVREDTVVCDSQGRALALRAGSKVQLFAHNPATLLWYNTTDEQTFVVDPRRGIKMSRTPLEQDTDGGDAPSNPTPQEPHPASQPDGPSDRPDPEGIEENIESSSGDLAPPRSRSDSLDGGDAGDEDILPVIQTPPPPPELTPDVPDREPLVGVQDTPQPEMDDMLLREMPIYLDDEELDHAIDAPATDFEARVLAAQQEVDLAALARVEQVSPADFSQTDGDFCEHCWAFKFEHADYCQFGRMG